MSDRRIERKTKTRAAIVQSADRLLRSAGVQGASVASVMKGAGLTVGGFYAHFDSKEALIEEVLATAMGAMRSLLTHNAPPKKGTRRLEVALARYLTPRHRDHPELGCPLPASLGDIAEDERLRPKLVEEIERHVEILAEEDFRERALGTLALMVGGLSLARAVAGTPLSDEILRAALALGRRAFGRGPK